ncbi:uncharacterized protein LY89DRAFT_743884 [Mollisia scopiformis]|uniref:Uncharacterized protein n=1 Tax=Mollisia scopiformis TaxID=149040 RepID=A0A132B1Y8_MOLSC|nr:uncharacterized protein LY89DRAFT_743884 [Mollisia scopiformis]KUJ06408.1 hypothetical protein LY89DRAFT_743884 [Mollisia scopiformis]
MDESSSFGHTATRSISEPDQQITPFSDTETITKIHSIIAAAEIVEETSDPSEQILHQSTISSPSRQQIDQDEESEIWYDLSHISHDHQNPAPEGNAEASNDIEQVPIIDATEEVGPIHSSPQGTDAPLTEVEVWDLVDSTGKHAIATVIQDEGIPDESAIIDEEPLETIAVTVAIGAALDNQTEIEELSGEEGAPVWVIILALTVWCCFIVILIGITCYLAHSMNWHGVEIFTAVALPLPSKAWLAFFHLPEGLSLTQAKGVDFAAGAVIAPVFIGVANFVWFKTGRKLSPKIDHTNEVPNEETGIFNLSKLLGFMRTSNPRLVLLAVLLLSSALASTLLSNVLGYKAIPAGSAEDVGAETQELLYQMVYIPGILFLALCAVTSASTAALSLVLLDWRSALSKKNQLHQARERGDGIATDEHDIGCENVNTRAHDYVSFPRFHTSRRLFSRGGREIFNSSRRNTSGEGEMEPLLQRTQSHVGSLGSPGSWRLPSFRFPTFTSRKKVGDIEGSREIATGFVADVQESEQNEGQRASLALWTLPRLTFPVWRRTQSLPMMTQQAELHGDQNPAAAPPIEVTTPTVPNMKQGRKFWKFLTYGTLAAQDEAIANQSSEGNIVSETGATSDMIPDIRVLNSLWKLPFPSAFAWPSGSWRSERRTRQREEASDTSSLLSQVEREEVTLARVERTPSFWVVPSSTGHYVAPTPKVTSKDPSLEGEHNKTVSVNERLADGKSSEPRPGWSLPRSSFWSMTRWSTDAETSLETLPTHAAEAGQHIVTESINDSQNTSITSRQAKSHRKQYSLDPFTWFPKFTFPLVLVDVPHQVAERRTLLPAFEETSPSNQSKSKTRTLTASEALNIAIGNDSMSSTSRSSVMKEQMIQISSQGYDSTAEAMTYNADDVLRTRKGKRVDNSRTSGKRPSQMPGVAVPPLKLNVPHHPVGWSVPWIHLPLFSRDSESEMEGSKLIAPIQTQSDNFASSSLAPSPSILPSPTKKGKETEQHVDQVESMIERVHELDAPVVIHEQSVVMQPARIDEDDDDIGQKAALGVGWVPWGSRRMKPDDVETARTTGKSRARSLTPMRQVPQKSWLTPHGYEEARSGIQTTSPNPSPNREDRGSWKGWTWWDVTWPHVVDVDQSGSPSTTASPRQVSATSTTSSNDSTSHEVGPQKRTPDARSRPTFTGSNDSYRKRRPLWGLGKASYQLPQPSPVSIMLPKNLSPRLSNSRSKSEEFVEQAEPSEASSEVWYSGGTQLLIEGPKSPKGKRPAKYTSLTEWPWSHDHHFKADEEDAGPSFWVDEGEGSRRSRKWGNGRRRASHSSERSARKQGGEVDTEPSVENVSLW